MDFSKSLQRIKTKHLWYLLSFLLALVLRIFAANQLAASSDEAVIFINLTNAAGTTGLSGSILYQILTKPLVALFRNTILVFRFWVILAGALITLLPLLYKDSLGKRTGVVLSFLLMMDPFQIANGIQVNGSSLSILFLFTAIGFGAKEKYGFSILAFFAFLLSGLNIHYGIILMVLSVSVNFMLGQKKNLHEKLHDVCDYVKNKYNSIFAIGCVIIFVLFILGIPVSDFLSQILQVIQNWGQPYAIGLYPQLFPLALLSYLPIVFIGLYPTGQMKIKREVVAAFFLGFLIMLIFVAFYPGHSVLDLVWVSLPICLICAPKINNLVEKFLQYPPRIHIYTILLTIVLISMAIHFGMVVYKLKFGINLLADLLSLATLLILLVMAVIFLTSSESLSLTLSAASAGFLLVLLTIQLAFSWRATGLNGNQAAEILWGKYFQDNVIVENILENADLKSIDSGLDNRVAFLDYKNSAVEWSIRQKYSVDNMHFGLGENNFAVVITETSTALDEKTMDAYYGENFVAGSYPLWTWKPIQNLITGDYWTWLLTRQGDQVHEYHYVWLNKNLFQ